MPISLQPPAQRNRSWGWKQNESVRKTPTFNTSGKNIHKPQALFLDSTEICLLRKPCFGRSFPGHLRFTASVCQGHWGNIVLTTLSWILSDTQTCSPYNLTGSAGFEAPGSDLIRSLLNTRVIKHLQLSEWFLLSKVIRLWFNNV